MNYKFPWFYKILNLPSLPNELEKKLWERYEDQNRDHYAISTNKFLHPELALKPNPGDVKGVRNGEIFPNCRGSRFQVQDEINAWVVENVCHNFIDIGLYIIHGDQHHGTILPHTDQTRALSLLYLLDPGGKDVETVFWQEKEQDLHREMKTLVGDYSVLKKIKSVQWPSRTWVLLNTNILHSVENMTSKRVHFQISLSTDPDLPVTYIELC